MERYSDNERSAPTMMTQTNTLQKSSTSGLRHGHCLQNDVTYEVQQQTERGLLPGYDPVYSALL
eukprot:1744860-Amphidinium_carterae.1